MKRFLIGIGLAIFLSACNIGALPMKNEPLEAQANFWRSVGSNINQDGSSNLLPAQAISLDNNDNPYVAARGAQNFSIPSYVKHWNGNNWQRVGTFTKDISALKVGSDGVPVALVTAPVDGWGTIAVNRWNGSSWTELGSLLRRTSPTPSNPVIANLSFLILDNSNNPIVAFEEKIYEFSPVFGLILISKNLYVNRWNGSTWIPLGGSLSSSFNTFSLALNATGNPVIAWSNSSQNRTFFMKWNGSSWVSIAEPLIDTYTGNDAFVLDNSGNPVVALTRFESSRDVLYVHRWNGSSWVRVGGALNTKAQSNSYSFALKVDPSNNPVVAFSQNTNTNPSNYDAYVKSWNGTSWQTLGGALDSALGNSAFSVSLDLDNSGNPIVIWEEEESITIYVKRWLGDHWEVLSGNLKTSPNNDIADPSIVVPINTGNPMVAWQEFNASNPGDIYVKEFKNYAWTAFGTVLDIDPNNKAFSPVMSVATNGRPVVSFLETDNTNVTRVYNKRWAGSSWITNGSALNVGTNTSAFEVSMKLRTDDRPVVAWSESSISNANNHDIYVKRWGSTWVAIGTALDTTLARNAKEPSLMLDTSDNPIVAWSEFGGTGQSYNIYVKKWSGTVWVSLGGALDTTLSANAQTPVIARGSDNNPIVAWSESGNIYVKRWNSTTSAWVAMGSEVDTVVTSTATRPSLAIRNDGRPVISWQEANNIYVKRWTGNTWTAIGGIVDAVQNNATKTPVLALRYDNKPFVAFPELAGTLNDLIVREYCCAF